MNMRRILTLLLALLFLPLPALCAETEAADITSLAQIAVSRNLDAVDKLLDGSYATCWSSDKYARIEFSLPENAPCFGLYVNLYHLPQAYGVQVYSNGEWVDAYVPETIYYNQFIPLNGETHFSLYAKKGMSVSGVRLFGAGTLPPDVQIWQPPYDKADLLLLAAHPDDELLWFGGLLPTYAGEKGLKVQVAYMTSRAPRRRNELLDGLWTCGVRHYPVLGVFADKYTNSLDQLYRDWVSKWKVEQYITYLLRTYRPEVVVTQDRNGEYGHAAHKALARSTIQAVKIAANPNKNTDRLKGLETWQIKKLYLHLYSTGRIQMDWSLPLAAFGGKTSLEVSQEAFQKHVSQRDKEYAIQDYGPNDCRLFGLAFSAVGEDVEKNDFFEHIQLAE